MSLKSKNNIRKDRLRDLYSFFLSLDYRLFSITPILLISILIPFNSSRSHSLYRSRLHFPRFLHSINSISLQLHPSYITYPFSNSLQFYFSWFFSFYPSILHYINSISLQLHPSSTIYSIYLFDYDFIVIISSLSITPFISFHRLYRTYEIFKDIRVSLRIAEIWKNNNLGRGSSNIREANKSHRQSLKSRIRGIYRLKTYRSACRTGPVVSIPDNVVEIAPSTSKSLKWLCIAPAYPVCPLSPVYPEWTIHIERPPRVAAYPATTKAASTTATTSREASEKSLTIALKWGKCDIPKDVERVNWNSSRNKIRGNKEKFSTIAKIIII